MAPRRKRTARKAPVRRSGLYAGHAKRQSLVAVEKTTFSRESEHTGLEFHNYIVRTDREATASGRSSYTHQIEYKGEIWDIPGKVVDQIIRHRDSIATEMKRVKAEETKETLARRAQIDQQDARDEAEKERAQNLRGG